MKEIISQIIGNIRAYNKFMPLKKLEKMSIDELLANCHPIDRKEFEVKLGIKQPLFG